MAYDDLHASHPFLNGAGTPVDDVTTDIDGEARDPANPDIGADEFEGCPPVAGTYTIDPAGGNYDSFTEAVDSMYHCSLAGPVIFDVAGGIYNEQIHLYDIPGSSQANSITFRSASGDSTAVTLTFDADSSGNNYTVKLEGMQSVTFRDMTLSATDPVYGRVVALNSVPSGNRFLNNRIIGVPGSSELIWSDATADSNHVYSNNVFSGGEYGLCLNGPNLQSEAPPGTQICGNHFNGQAEAAIYLDRHKQPLVESNLIESDSTSTGISLYYPYDFYTVRKNRIHLGNGGNGIENSSGVYSDTSLITNNHIFIYDTLTLESNGIYTISDLPLKILHNSVHISGKNTSSKALHNYYMGNPYIELYNNILSNRAFGLAISSNDIDESDYNDLFTNGKYLANYENTLEEWQSAYNLDTNSVSVLPYFYPDTAYLCFNSLLNNAGIPLAEVADDIEGEIRDVSTPDIGADEFDLAGTPLSGSYTIGAGGDYTDFSGAAADLAGRGVSGPVTFDVKAGTYHEQVFLPEIAGASETNTVTIRSETGDSSDVLLTFDPLGEDSRLRSVLMLDGTDHLILDHLSVSSGENFGWPLYLAGGATNNTIRNNRFFYEKTASKIINNLALVYSNGSLDSNNVFTANRLENAPMGISLGTGSVQDSITGTKITGNVFRDMLYGGIYLACHDNFEIGGNDIQVMEGYYNHGVIQTNNSRGTVYNNFVRLESAGQGRGIYMSGSDYGVYHNTVKISGSGTDNESLYLDAAGSICKNNVLVNVAGGEAAYYDTTGLVSDYNLYYGTGNTKIYGTGSILANDLEEWQTGSGGRDMHSVYRLPEFVSDSNLHMEDPWIANTGTPVASVSKDIDGEVRDLQHPDLGADEYDVPVPLSGTYTIGPVSADFESFGEALDSLVAVGYMGNVFFDVEDGTYNEQMVIPCLSSMEEDDPVTFRSASGDSTAVVLQYDSPADSNYVVKLDSADHIVFAQMTLRARDSLYTRVVEFAGGASYNQLTGNVLVGGGQDNAVVCSIGDNDHHNTVSRNRILYGKVGVQMKGISESDREQGTVIHGNVFRDQVSTAVYLEYQEAPRVTANDIIYRGLKEDEWAGIGVKNSPGGDYGLLANNMIRIRTSAIVYGIGLDNASRFRIYNNSVLIQGDATSSRAIDHASGSDLVLRNNILSNTAGGPALVTRNTAGLSSDYNNLHTDGNRFINVNSTIWVDSLDVWQSDYNQDLHSLSVAPGFLADTNLHTGSPFMNGTGISLAEVSVDFDGDPRDGTHPDMGADEFETVYYTVGEDTTLCNDAQIVLDAGEGFDSYAWNTGENTRRVTVDSSLAWMDYIRVTVTFSGNLYADSLDVDFTGPVVRLRSDTAFCQGGSVRLDAGEGAYSYLWSDMSTGRTLTVTGGGEYKVTVTDSLGCTDSDSVTVTVHPLPDVTLTQDMDTLEAGSLTAIAYDWYDMTGVIDSVSGDRYAPGVSGDFYVVVTDADGCMNTSDTLGFVYSGLPPVPNDQHVRVYPNPTRGGFAMWV